MSDLLKTAAWSRLASAAKAFGVEESKASAQALSDAAKAWHSVTVAAPGEVKGTRGNTLRSGQVVPFGRDKGTPIEEADVKSLQWVAGCLRESIVDPAKERWAPANRTLLDAIETELETR